MMNNSIIITIATPVSPQTVFEALLNVSAWWGFEDLKGSTRTLHDVFTIQHPGAHYSKQQIVELIPGKRLVFLVTESRLDWLKDPEEWTNTRMVFELSPGQLRFTHDGLTPEKECYEKVSEGWKTVIQDYFLKTIPEK